MKRLLAAAGFIGPEANLPRLLAWTRTNDQLELFGGIA